MITYNNGLVNIHRISKEKVHMAPNDILNNNRHNEQLLKLPRNDTGNARRFLLYCKKCIVYNTGIQEWMIWNGKYWQSENAKAEIFVLAQAVMEKYYEAAKKSKLEEKEKNALIRHAIISNNNNSLENILAVLKHMNYVKEMKCKPYYLNTQNGIVNLKTKELLKHRPEYGCTNICACKYDPDAKSTRFKVYLKEVTDNNKNIYKYLKTLFGMSCTGYQKEEKIFWLKGTGGNGKSKLLEAIEFTLGDYAASFPITALLKSNNSAGKPTPELIPLIGKRFAHTSELKSDNIINDSAIKQLTGNSKISVRKMCQEFTEAEISFKIFIDTNYSPNFKNFDAALERRIVIIPFTRKFEGASRDLNIKEKLIADCEYILKFLVDGAHDYIENGLTEPEEIISATKEYCYDADSISCFLRNATRRKDGAIAKSSVLYEAYKKYCYESSFEPIDIKGFSQGLTTRNYTKKSKNTGTFFMNIEII